MFEDPTDISIELSPVGGRKQQVFPLAILWPLSLGVALAVRVPARSPQLLAEKPAGNMFLAQGHASSQLHDFISPASPSNTQNPWIPLTT